MYIYSIESTTYGFENYINRTDIIFSSMYKAIAYLDNIIVRESGIINPEIIQFKSDFVSLWVDYSDGIMINFNIIQRKVF